MTTAYERLQGLVPWLTKGESEAILVNKSDLSKLLAVVDAARAVHESGHNGNLYAREYNQLTEALTALDNPQ